MATKKTTTGTTGAAKPKVTAAAKPMATPAVKPKAAPVAKPKDAPAAAKPKPVAAPKETESALAAAPLTVGSKAPSFKLVADSGAHVSLSDFAGKNVVLYFYPRDNTPGCTREACSFQENIGAIGQRGAVVLGVSRDSAASHAGFKTKYGLSFPLLVDTDLAVHKAYGAFGKKVNYGREIIGPLRSTVIIDKKGRVAKIYPSVKVDGHTDQVLAALDALS